MGKRGGWDGDEGEMWNFALTSIGLNKACSYFKDSPIIKHQIRNFYNELNAHLAIQDKLICLSFKDITKSAIASDL